MPPTQDLHDLGQSLWLDNISRGLLTSGMLARYVSEFSVTGLTSNPSIFEQAIRNTAFYDDAIRRKAAAPTASRSTSPPPRSATKCTSRPASAKALANVTSRRCAPPALSEWTTIAIRWADASKLT